MQNKEYFEIRAYTFFDFCLKLEQGVSQGYSISTEKGQYPSSSIGYYSATLVKDSKEASEKTEAYLDAAAKELKKAGEVKESGNKAVGAKSAQTKAVKKS